MEQRYRDRLHWEIETEGYPSRVPGSRLTLQCTSAYTTELGRGDRLDLIHAAW